MRTKTERHRFEIQGLSFRTAVELKAWAKSELAKSRCLSGQDDIYRLSLAIARSELNLAGVQLRHIVSAEVAQNRILFWVEVPRGHPMWKTFSNSKALEAWEKQREIWRDIPENKLPRRLTEKPSPTRPIEISMSDLYNNCKENLSVVDPPGHGAEQVEIIEWANKHGKLNSHVLTRWLKSGRDEYSSMSELDLLALASVDVASAIGEQFRNGERIACALRWYFRGLSVRNAIVHTLGRQATAGCMASANHLAKFPTYQSYVDSFS
jgi:hypothetical protein